MEFAELLTHTRRNPLTGEVFVSHYTWMGSPYAPIKIESWLWERRDRLPWRLEEISSDFGFFFTAIRTDTSIPVYAYYRFERDMLALTAWWQWIGARLILTAQVWGFAFVPPGHYPTWEHLFKRHPSSP